LISWSLIFVVIGQSAFAKLPTKVLPANGLFIVRQGKKSLQSWESLTCGIGLEKQIDSGIFSFFKKCLFCTVFTFYCVKTSFFNTN